MSTPTSRIVEIVNEDLINDDGLSTVVVKDRSGNDFEYEVPVKLNNPFAFDRSRFTPNAEPMTLERFFQIAGELIDDAQEREQVVEDERVQLVEDYPAEEFQKLGDEVITWKVRRRAPAKMSSTATGREQRKGMFSHDLRSPDHPNKVIIVEARPIDHEIEFSCWSKSATIANRRVLWLERLFISYDWAFKIQGVDRIYWKERGIDTYTTTGQQRLFQRPLVFFVRLVELTARAEPLIAHIQTKLQTATENNLNRTILN